jgi:hypothetical protein
MSNNTTVQLPEITYPLVVDTIGKTLAMGADISLACYNCEGSDRHRRLNLVKLARRYGMDYPSGQDSLIKVVFCPSCRSAGRYDRNIGFIHHANSLPHSIWPREANSYAKAKGG